MPHPTLHRIADLLARKHPTASKKVIEEHCRRARLDGLLPMSIQAATDQVCDLLDHQVAVRKKRIRKPIPTIREGTLRRTAEIIERLAPAMYRIARSRWVGGDHETHVNFGTPRATGTGEKEWNKKGWSGTNSRFDITVPVHWLASVHQRGLSSPTLYGNVRYLVLAATPIPGYRCEVYKVVVVRQSRGLSLRTEEKYLARIANFIAYATNPKRAVKCVADSMWNLAKKGA